MNPNPFRHKDCDACYYEYCTARPGCKHNMYRPSVEDRLIAIEAKLDKLIDAGAKR